MKRGKFMDVPVGTHFRFEHETYVKLYAAAEPNLDPRCNSKACSGGMVGQWCRFDPEAEVIWEESEFQDHPAMSC